MKKQRFFMLGIITVLVAVLSLTFVSSTFAKYTSNGTATDSARVAKWGVVVKADVYKDDQLEADLTTTEDGIVTSATAPDLLAPGTGINFASISITGTPEVSVEVIYTATLTLEGWSIDGTDYVPLVFVIEGTEVKGATMAELKANVEAAIAGHSKPYAAGTNLADQAENALQVSCYWAFNGDDAKDTALGDAAATGTAPSINLVIKLKSENLIANVSAGLVPV